MQNNKFSYGSIPVSKISLFGNSRSNIDMESVKELADSILSIGMINPITVVVYGDSYKLISGNRRFQAVRLLNHETIDAKIYESLSKDDEFIINCTENIQREDISLEDEVVIIRYLAENGMDDRDISVQLGKSLYFVRNRKYLSNLVPELWDHLKSRFITNNQAASFARFDTKTQIQIAKGISGILTSEEHSLLLASLEKPLLNLEFINKENLHPTMGACVNCEFNTAINSLFPDEEARCTYLECYERKRAEWDALKIIERLDKETILVVTTAKDLYSNHEKMVIAALDKAEVPYHVTLSSFYDIAKGDISGENWIKAIPITGPFFMDDVYVRKKQKTTNDLPDAVATSKPEEPVQMKIDEYNRKLEAAEKTYNRKLAELLPEFLIEKKYLSSTMPLELLEWNWLMYSAIVSAKAFDDVKAFNPDFVGGSLLTESDREICFAFAKTLTIENPVTFSIFRKFMFSCIQLNSDMFRNLLMNIARVHYKNDFDYVYNEQKKSFNDKQKVLLAKIAALAPPVETLTETSAEVTKIVPEPIKEETPIENPAFIPSPTTKRVWKQEIYDAENIINSIYGGNRKEK